MLFKYPEILYALFLLALPIIIHLFQLRRFQKVPFTNVEFLKKITIQTRKSSQIKKWLTLLTRLLLIAAIVLAFAQPYTSNLDSFDIDQETVIYLDNSYSLQAKGDNGSLLQEAIQDIVGNFSNDKKLTIITNDSEYRNTTLGSIKNDLLQLGYSSIQLDYQSAYLKAINAFSDNRNSLKNLLYVSDFQQNNNDFEISDDSSVNLNIVQLKPKNTNNIGIDSVFISNKSSSKIELSVILKNQGEEVSNLSVSLYNKDEIIGKTSTDIKDTAKIEFTINNNENIEGRIQISDTQLQFDNTFYFSLNDSEKINVLTINEGNDKFLSKIYNSNEFNYKSISLENLNYSELETKNLIVLNELNKIPNSLINSIDSFVKQNGTVLIIPSNNINLNSYNQLFTVLNGIIFNERINSNKNIFKINFSHPLFKDVFNKTISNFQYPKVNSFYPINHNIPTVLSYEDGASFLIGSNNIYTFSASINNLNSNFQNSPLIVPTLYNIGKQSLSLSKLYYTIGRENSIDVNTTLNQDEILTLQKEEVNIIPLQQSYNKKVKITTINEPNIAGIYSVKNNDLIIEKVAYNLNRTESNMEYKALNIPENVNLSNSVANVLTDIKSATKVNELWKWFVIFALIMLIFEMLILKLFK